MFRPFFSRFGPPVRRCWSKLSCGRFTQMLASSNTDATMQEDAPCRNLGNLVRTPSM